MKGNPVSAQTLRVWQSDLGRLQPAPLSPRRARGSRRLGPPPAPSGPGPLPASRPRPSPPRLRCRRGRHWCGPAPEGRPLAAWEVIHPRIPPPAGLRGNFLIIVTPKTEKPRAGPEGLSPSESRGAVRLLLRCAGRGPGFQGGGPAELQPRRAGHGCQRAAPGAAAAAAGRFPRRPGAGARDVGARRLQCLRARGGGGGAAPGRGAPDPARALGPKKPPRPAGPEAAVQMGAPPAPARCPQSGRNCDAESQKEDPPLPPRLPPFQARAAGDPLAVRRAGASPRSGSRRGLRGLGNPGGAEEFALRTRGSASR